MMTNGRRAAARWSAVAGLLLVAMAGGGALAQGGAPSGALDPAEFEYVRGLGVYAEGRGDADDLAEAAQAFRNAARAGHPAARRHLAVMYERGQGVPRDLERAYAWLSLAIRAYPEGPDRDAAIRQWDRIGGLLDDAGRARAETLMRSVLESDAPAVAATVGPTARPSEGVASEGTAPADTDPAATAAANILVQVAAAQSEAEAEAVWQEFRLRHPRLLGERAVRIERADLGRRGVFYRVRTGPFDAAEAKRICDGLRRAGTDCFLVSP